MNNKWYKSTEPTVIRRWTSYSFFKLSVASCLFILTFSFFRGIAKRLPLSLLMGQPSWKCFLKLVFIWQRHGTGKISICRECLVQLGEGIFLVGCLAWILRHLLISLQIAPTSVWTVRSPTMLHRTVNLLHRLPLLDNRTGVRGFNVWTIVYSIGHKKSDTTKKFPLLSVNI